MAVTEHLVLYPACYFIDRFHPARGQPGIPPLLTSRRAFAQATRRRLFGIVLGSLVRKNLPARYEAAEPVPAT